MDWKSAFVCLGRVAQDNLKELGKRIRQQRKSLGWSQEKFALEAEIDRSYVGGVERGQRNLTFTVLCRLCDALGCDIAALTVNLPPTPDR